ncbi:MAG: Omp28-related outer membrane protein [Brumimicrobium sp.]|nr:Omp28-related outer membrane protein [Brumimicrobium sp.]
MKKLRYSLLLLAVVVGITACDKIDNPYEKVVNYDIDTTLYPGAWQDYLANEYPTFAPNPNTNVNVLIEDYTGHLCSNCPNAATKAHQIHQNYPTRVFIASIHAGPGGKVGFQQTNTSGPYTTDHTNSDGILYGETFENGYNFIGNPQGTVNRKIINGKMFDFLGTWESRAQDIMTANDLKVNIQSVFNYYSQTNGGYLHVEVEKMKNEAIEMNAVVYVIQDSLVDWQLMPDNSDNEFYIHRDKHLGSIDNRPWGQKVFDAATPVGEKKIFDYSYKLPTDIDKENLHFLIYVYDVDTYEILQVIRQDIN